MRVAIIDPLGQYAGNHHYTDQLARGLTDAGATVTVYAHAGNVDHSPDRPYTYLESFFGIYGSRHLALRGLQFVRCLLGVFYEISRRRTDLIHVQAWEHDIRELLQVGIAKLLRKKVVLTVHDIVNFGNKSRARNLAWMLSRADGIVVHNKYCSDLLKSRYRPTKPVAVIPHVNQAGSIGELPDRASARARLQLPESSFIFLFFGNCRKEKGLEVALRALAEFKDLRDELLFVTGGKMKPSEEAHFRHLVDSLNLANLVRMDVGLIPDDFAIDYYCSANIVVVPYLQIYESGVAITASTCARAIIASDLPPLREVTENGRLGLLFRTGDSHDLANTMKLAMSMEDELDSIGAAMRSKVLMERDPKVIGKMTFDLYATLLGGTQRRKLIP